MYPGIFNPSRSREFRRDHQRTLSISFTCTCCGSCVLIQPVVSGVQNRNHCPYCLYSRHVDHERAGDRLSACKAIMQPIGLTVKPGRNKYRKNTYGELMLIHRCSACGKLSLNRLAADDLVDRLIEIYRESLGMDRVIQHELCQVGIRPLTVKDWEVVIRQLQGAWRT